MKEINKKKIGERGMCEIPDKYRQKSHKIQKIQTDPDKSRQFQTFWEIQTIPDAVGTL